MQGLDRIPSADVQATLVEFTCRTIADSIEMCDSRLRVHERVDEIYVCGGGARNRFLLKRLQYLMPNTKVSTTDELGISPELVESVAFAWLAYRTINKLSGNLPSATGAKHERILGAVYAGNEQ